MPGDQESLQKQLREALEGKRRAEEREKKLMEQLKARENVEGNMQWEMEVKKVEEDFIFSPYTPIGSLPFRIACRNKSGWLEIYLYCNDNSTSKTYSALVAFTLKISSAKGAFSQSYCALFTPSAIGHGGQAQHAWTTIVLHHAQNGFITVEAQIKVVHYSNNTFIDFSSADPQLSDVTLLLGGKKIHSNRMFLAHYSEYFKATFCSDFAEKKKDEIELEQVDPDEFEVMLGVIYPQRKKVTAATVTGLLRMADFFDVPFVTRKCTSFLKKSTDFTLIAKLLLTEEFRLPELQHCLVAGLKSFKETKPIINSADFGKFSLILRNSILQKHFQLSC